MSDDEDLAEMLLKATKDLEDSRRRLSRFRREGDDDGPGSHVREPRKPKDKDSSGGAAMEIPVEETVG